MSKYQILINKSAKKDLQKIQKGDQEKILIAIQNLAIIHRSGGYKQLRGMKNLYRVRVGDYRVVYQIINKEVTIIVVRIGHRSTVYKQ